MLRKLLITLLGLSILLPGLASASIGPNAENRIKGDFLTPVYSAPGATAVLPSVYAGIGLISTQNCIGPEFPGQYYDSESGLHYNYKRYYSPETGRYISMDPLRADDTGYSYLGNNPMAGIDPNGENPLLVAGGISALTSVISTLISNPNASGGDLLKSATAGFAVGFSGFGAAKYLSVPVKALLGKAGIAVGPFIESIVKGALAGSVGGLVSGSLEADPCISLIGNVVVGGVFGALLGPLSAILKVGNFGLGAKAAVGEAEGMILGGIATLPAKLAVSGAKREVLDQGNRQILPGQGSGYDLGYLENIGSRFQLRSVDGPTLSQGR